MKEQDFTKWASETIKAMEKLQPGLRPAFLATRVLNQVIESQGLRKSDQMAVVVELHPDGRIESVLSNIPLLSRAVCIVVQEESGVGSGSHTANFHIEGEDKTVTEVRVVSFQRDLESHMDAAREFRDNSVNRTLKGERIGFMD